MTLADTYRDVAHQAMLDLVRQPREVVYAADPYIAALEAENERSSEREQWWHERATQWEMAKQQADAEMVNLEERRKAAESDYLDVRAEAEKLRCCGNCEHYDHMKRSYDPCEEECDSRPTDDTPYPEGYDHDESLFDGMNAWDSCHWTLSRWTAREEAGGANATRFAGQCWGGSDTPDERAREEAGDE